MKDKSLEWVNETGLDLEGSKDVLLGFIYRIDCRDGSFYIGRKQFWNKRGKHWYESDWVDYESSSRTILSGDVQIERKTILAAFQSKSALRYAEAAAIICSGSYLSTDKGLNGGFENCRGPLKFSEQDLQQLKKLTG